MDKVYIIFIYTLNIQIEHDDTISKICFKNTYSTKIYNLLINFLRRKSMVFFSMAALSKAEISSTISPGSSMGSFWQINAVRSIVQQR
jgi:hypothetical protein